MFIGFKPSFSWVREYQIVLKGWLHGSDKVTGTGAGFELSRGSRIQWELNVCLAGHRKWQRAIALRVSRCICHCNPVSDVTLLLDMHSLHDSGLGWLAHVLHGCISSTTHHQRIVFPVKHTLLLLRYLCTLMLSGWLQLYRTYSTSSTGIRRNRISYCKLWLSFFPTWCHFNLFSKHWYMTSRSFFQTCLLPHSVLLLPSVMLSSVIERDRTMASVHPWL